MVRARDLERDGAFDAMLLGRVGYLFKPLQQPREHDLSGAVEVGDINVDFLGDGLCFFGGGANQRQHAAWAGIAGLLHGRPAGRDEPEAVFEGERPGCRMGRKFAQ